MSPLAEYHHEMPHVFDCIKHDFRTGKISSVEQMYRPLREDPSQLDRIEKLLRTVAAEPVESLGKFVVEKRGRLWVAEKP